MVHLCVRRAPIEWPSDPQYLCSGIIGRLPTSLIEMPDPWSTDECHSDRNQTEVADRTPVHEKGRNRHHDPYSAEDSDRNDDADLRCSYRRPYQTQQSLKSVAYKQQHASRKNSHRDDGYCNSGAAHVHLSPALLGSTLQRSSRDSRSGQTSQELRNVRTANPGPSKQIAAFVRHALDEPVSRRIGGMPRTENLLR